MKIVICILTFLLLLPLQASWTFKSPFFFGIANAPVHVEDSLPGIWQDFAHQGKVAAFHNQADPYRALDFWSNPEVEIQLAHDLGVEVFRLGIDWQRVEPLAGKYDQEVLARYLEIVRMIKNKGMKVMLTLFHHAEPRWSLHYGSWKNHRMVDEFVRFSKVVLEELGSEVDYVITLNEAHVYLLLGQISNLWPSPSTKADYLGMVDFGFLGKGSYTTSLENMSLAHHQVYSFLHQKFPQVRVGIAHNVAWHRPHYLISAPMVQFSKNRFNYQLMDYLVDSVDFIGLNYYGVESIGATGVVISDDYEYSDSGRAISPQGLYQTVKDFNHRYNQLKVGRRASASALPFIITENGVADSLDILRPSYLIEHLLAVHRLRDEGIAVLGYIHWTLSDNWEWADGYCPKFGLVAVDRKENNKRMLRPSFELYRKIISSRQISEEMREKAWKHYLEEGKKKQQRFCRARDGQSSLNIPEDKKYLLLDWRFNPSK